MSRTIGWFSCGAASAVACKLAGPDVWAYCDTGAEHPDNARFMRDVETRWGVTVTILKNEQYVDTWDVWEKRKYLAGPRGAPCTKELKVKPRLEFQRPDDVHLFGYTADKTDRNRYEALRHNYPELDARAPLIEAELTKAACLGLLQNAGIAPPITYAIGLPNANCIPCVKAQSPAYWALIRRDFPEEFARMVEVSRARGVRLARIKRQWVYIDEIPVDQPTTNPIVADCDFLCQLHQEGIADADEP